MIPIFDAQIQVIQFEATPADTHAVITMVLGLALPVGPGQVMPLPAGALRAPITKTKAKELIGELQAAIQDLPDEQPQSDIVVASSLSDVDKAAQVDRQFRGQ